MDMWMHTDTVDSLLLFTMDAQQMDMLIHRDTVESCCYCSLWMPQQMDLLLHMDIVNIIVIVIVIFFIKGYNRTTNYNF